MKDSQLEEVMNKMIIEFSKTLELFGLTPLESRLFVYLYLTDDPLTLDEMSEALGKSKTSMSTSIRSLFDLNLVTRVWKKGVRKDLYEANSHLYKSFSTIYISKWLDSTNHHKDTLMEIRNEIDSPKKATISKEKEKLNKKLDEIINFHVQIEGLFNNMKQ
ncbi:GbsR/MarR family transcriptional regulator [Virgibacillus halodenitrificans]|uniref:GbsR/MarR family transcriptional regulator n=1 Tax=Virgibacillus halodenitrificans TaxID=1482 RepID=UPI0002FA679B|nr:helix-turn-helix domain-containing protein [Virgibacillus halodenitrificans]MYL60547.1 transcriptional regulator [Virgibacillus halodenitrificans]